MALRIFFSISLLSFHVLLASLKSTTSTPVSLNAANDKNWRTAVRKGKIYWEQLQSGCYPDKQNPATLEELFSKGYSFSEAYGRPWPPDRGSSLVFEHDVFETLGWTEDRDFFRLGFQCTYFPTLHSAQPLWR